ncbi:MAG: hypothetical protein HY814_01780, partial [Candidatus Riflebacteria bacterium]|nr:hypothetical protein [Candidatus Riflebacteria bacterium]
MNLRRSIIFLLLAATACCWVLAQEPDDLDLNRTGAGGGGTTVSSSLDPATPRDGQRSSIGERGGFGPSETEVDPRGTRAALTAVNHWELAARAVQRLEELLATSGPGDSNRSLILATLSELEQRVREAGSREGPAERALQVLETIGLVREDFDSFFRNGTAGMWGANPASWYRANQRTAAAATLRGRLRALAQVTSAQAEQVNPFATSSASTHPSESQPAAQPSDDGTLPATGSAVITGPEENPPPEASGDARPPIEVWFTAPPSTGGIDDALVRFLGTAKVSVAAHIYQLSDPKLVGAFVDTARRLGPGKVRFVTEYDYLHYRQVHADKDNRHAANGGSRASDHAAVYERAYGSLQAAGIEVVCDTSSTGGPNRGQSHNKFVVVDGSAVWTGSYNLTPQAAAEQNNNALLVRSPELARAYLQEFAEEADQHRFGERKQSLVPHRYDLGGTAVELSFSPSNETNQRLVNAIETADASIYVASFYLSDARLINALRVKREQGVDVKVVTDKLGASQKEPLDPDQPEVKLKVSDYLRSCDIGYKADTSSKLMHHKFAVIDAQTGSDPIVITGSHNWTKGADSQNDENTLVLHSGTLATQYLAEFRRRWAEPFQVPTHTVAPPAAGPAVLFTAVDLAHTPRTVELTCLDAGRSGSADLSRWQLQLNGKRVLAFPAGLVLQPDQKVLIASSAPAGSGNGHHAVYVASELTAASDGALLLTDKFARQRDAVAWADGNGNLTRTAAAFMNLLVVGGSWDGPDGLELTEGIACRAPRGTVLARRNASDTDSPDDWSAGRR